MDKELPWFVCEDFNEIMYAHEKVEGIPRDEKRMKSFRNTLEECDLFDVGYSGCWYTWERENSPTTNIRECLDRGVITVEWLECFPNVSIQHLSHSYSDHCPLLISSPFINSNKKSSRFRFKAWWILESTLEVTVKKEWDASTRNILSKLESLWVGLCKSDRQRRHERAGVTPKTQHHRRLGFWGLSNYFSLFKSSYLNKYIVTRIYMYYNSKP